MYLRYSSGVTFALGLAYMVGVYVLMLVVIYAAAFVV